MTQLHKETIEKLEATIKEAQLQIEELKKPVSNRWRARKGDTYFYIDCNGNVDKAKDLGWSVHDTMFSNGNYFKTETDAKASNLYILLGEYDYWIPGVTPCKPSFEPKGLQWRAYDKWSKSQSLVENWEMSTYRWKRSEQ